MVERSFIKDILKSEPGAEHTIKGWIYRTRSSGSIVFAVLRDSSGIIQVTVKKGNVPDQQFETAKKALVESSVIVQGTSAEDKRAPGGMEVKVSDFQLVQDAEPFPITKDQSEEWLRDNRHLWLRSQRMVSIMKVRHTVMGAIHEFFRERGYYEFDPPILQPNQCEGGSTLFEVKYYDRVTYLSQTWQLYAEAAIFALEKVYDVSPTFRAEKSKTSRHISEFWMAEMEAAWMELEELTEVAKDEIKYIIKRVLEDNRDDLELLNADMEKLERCLSKAFPSVTYTEALDIIKERSSMDVPWGKDLRTIEEEALMQHFDVPTVVTHYPKEVMAFYKPVEKDESKTGNAPGPVARCFDMLVPGTGVEIIGGSERDIDIQELVKYLEQEGENPENYSFYLDLRKYGSVPHSGYGVGVERLIAWICDLDNIKDAIAFPRTLTRMTP